MESLILIDRSADRRVETITFNRPRKRNALSFDALREFHRELRRLENDEQTRVVVLRGAEKTFCSGLDLREASLGERVKREELSEFEIPAFELEPETVDRGRVMPRLVQEGIKRIKLLPQIFVARAEGAACGGGAGTLAACDYAVAEPGFKFAFTETKRGIYPTLLFPFLSKIFPIAALKEFVLTARPFDVVRAKEIGLVQRVVEPEEMDRAIKEIVELFLSNERASLVYAKRMFAQKTLPTDDEIDEGWNEHWRSWNSDACRAGVLAFLEKRA